LTSADLQTATPSISPLSVLIVDDYPDTAASLALLLEFEGYAVKVALSCQEAREAISADLPDVILMDLGLPDGNGYDFALELADLRGRPPVLVSVSGFNPDPERATRVGFARHFVKPADPAVLSAYLRTCSTAR
jgi:CheY-like chemotaxis protein